MKRNRYFLAVLLLIATIHCAFGQCTPGSVANITAIIPSGATISIYGSPGGNTDYIEYGPGTFVPGTTAAPGGGTVVAFPVSVFSYTLTGLLPNTQYSFYLRRFCAATGLFTENSFRYTFATAFDCSTVPVITAGTNVPLIFPGGSSLHNICTYNGMDKVFKFTATVTGSYSLILPPSSNTYKIACRTEASGCSLTGWTCLSTNLNFSTRVYNINLTAGTNYYFLVIASTIDPLNTFFRIEAPGCTGPSSVFVYSSPSANKVVWSGTANVLEYGLHGFVPGSGNTAGAGGTIVSVSTSPYFLTGLTTGLEYDVYLRNSCGGNQYSQNKYNASFNAGFCDSLFNYANVRYLNSFNLNNISLWIYTPAAGQYFQTFGSCPGRFGREFNLLFTAPSSGYFDLFADNHTAFPLPFTTMMRTMNTNCNFTGFACQFPIPTSSNDFIIGPLTAGTTYHIMFDTQDTTNISFPTEDLAVKLSCPPPTDVAFLNSTPSSLFVTWAGHPQSVTIEYGKSGFIPGTGATAGPGGTVVSNVTSPCTIPGLVPDTKYDVYVRSSCGGVFTPNIQKSIRTAVDCATAPVLNCSDYFNYKTTVNLYGAWNTGTILFNPEGLEQIWRFTPSKTGAYSINIYSMNFSSTGYLYGMQLYTKVDTGACSANGWNYKGGLYTLSANFVPTTINLGSLDSGVTYLILADGSFHQMHYATFNMVLNPTPAQPSTIIITGGNGKVCPGDTRTYKVTNVAGTTYNWTVPIGANIQSGQGTFKIVVNYTPSFIASGSISVVPSNSCGAGTPRTLTVTRNNPATPASITGYANGVCGQINLPYSVTAVAGMTYNWSFNVGNAVVNSGQGTASIGANFNPGFTTGILSVIASNACGSSIAKTKTIKNLPAVPLSISGTAAPCIAQANVPYSVPVVPLVTTYKWTAPAGSQISDGVTTGAGTLFVTTSNAVTVTFGITAGNVTCKAGNSCGYSNAKSKAISFGCKEDGTDLSLANFEIRPNPFSGSASFIIPGNVELINAEIIIYDVLGKAVTHLTNLKDHTIIIDGQTMKPGIYALHFISDNAVSYTSRLTVVR